MASHPVARMACAGAACWVAVSLAAGADGRLAVLLGLLGPLAVAIGSWMVLERTHRRAPAQVPAALIKLFAAKIALIGAFVAAVAILLPAGRTAFAVSFTCHYVLLHAMEAWYLRRLFSDRPAALGVS